MNCIIIDDDKVSRMIIEKYISKTDFLKYTASFDNAVEAINYLNKDSDIDLIFLDIEMPEMNGVEFIENLQKLPRVIVVSAKEKYALQAIEYDVTDYLLKPVTYARFFKAVSKAYEKYKEETASKTTTEGIFIKSSSASFIRLLYNDIFWIEALENYVVVNTFDDKFTIHFTMKSLLDKLPAGIFKRIHRSFIVNVNKISIIEDNMIVMKTKLGNKSVPIAKSYKDDLLKDINIVTK
jgi:DNA-binding LytR/AlgR family response regulator